MKLFPLLLSLLTLPISSQVLSQSIDLEFDKFDAIYKTELGATRGCEVPEIDVFRVCSDSLRNDGNAPFILHHNKVTEKVIVLFHGLSDSPFFFRSIAKSMHQQGHNVVVALMPGHGKKQANDDMQDTELSDRWRAHVAEVFDFADGLGEQRYLGGFSTGGVLAAEYILQHPKSVSGLLLFSGALALDSGVETVAKIWGAQWLAKVLSGDYKTQGLNRYKYPGVAPFSAFELTEVIFSVRELIEQDAPLDLPIFSGHSVADVTTPISGVKNLMSTNKGPNVLFELPLSDDVCHADVVVNQAQVTDMQFDASKLEEILPCAVPKANPKHAEMLNAMQQFLTKY